MTTLEKLLSAADSVEKKCFVTASNNGSGISLVQREYRRVRDLYNVKKCISLNDDVIVSNGWSPIAYNDIGIRYRLSGEKPIDIIYYTVTGSYKVHYDGNVCKVRTLADIENFLSLVGVNIELRPNDLFG